MLEWILEFRVVVFLIRPLKEIIPAVFEGFPVRVSWGGRYAYGTLKSRPGRVLMAK